MIFTVNLADNTSVAQLRLQIILLFYFPRHAMMIFCSLVITTNTYRNKWIDNFSRLYCSNVRYINVDHPVKQRAAHIPPHTYTLYTTYIHTHTIIRNYNPQKYTYARKHTTHTHTHTHTHTSTHKDFYTTPTVFDCIFKFPFQSFHEDCC